MFLHVNKHYGAVLNQATCGGFTRRMMLNMEKLLHLYISTREHSNLRTRKA